jgi:hypothetical protein
LERERKREIRNKNKIDTHLLVKWKDQIKLDLDKEHDRRTCMTWQPQKVLPKVNPRNFRDLLIQI